MSGNLSLVLLVDCPLILQCSLFLVMFETDLRFYTSVMTFLHLKKKTLSINLPIYHTCFHKLIRGRNIQAQTSSAQVSLVSLFSHRVQTFGPLRFFSESLLISFIFSISVKAAHTHWECPKRSNDWASPRFLLMNPIFTLQLLADSTALTSTLLSSMVPRLVDYLFSWLNIWW